MQLEKIKIDNNTFVYKGKLNLFDKFDQSIFINKIEFLKYLYPEFIIKHSEENPGIQFPMLIDCDEINYIYNLVRNIELDEYKTTKDCIIRSWVYMSDNKNTYSGYHNHKELALQNNGHILKYNTTFTFTYYLQMPDKLENDDGYLYFKTDNVEVGFLPKEDEIWIFPPDLQHNVKTNKKSSKKRIVIASNVHCFDYNVAKLNKTLL